MGLLPPDVLLLPPDERERIVRALGKDSPYFELRGKNCGFIGRTSSACQSGSLRSPCCLTKASLRHDGWACDTVRRDLTGIIS